jgi:2-iminobutanoate/2-iminopropanoate deaminase
MKQSIATTKTPLAKGPYSQAIQADNFIFLSGQLPIDVETSTVPDSIRDQTRICIMNLIKILESCGCTIDDVIKTTLFIKQIDELPEINDIYKTYFKEPYPARSCVEVSSLMKDARIEIEAVAVK